MDRGAENAEPAPAPTGVYTYIGEKITGEALASTYTLVYYSLLAGSGRSSTAMARLKSFRAFWSL